MPRMQRLEFPGALAHVFSRGLEGIHIFRDHADHIEYLRRLEKHRAASGCKCLTWCLMDNHFHLLIRSSDLPLCRLMRPLNSGYARWFNRKYSRRGYLLQDRFNSILCQDLEYARQLIRYINLNPIRAGIVHSLTELLDWPWCGHAHILGRPSAFGQTFQDRFEVLRRFGETESAAIAGYLAYLAEGLDNPTAPETAGMLPDDSVFEMSGSQKGWPAVIGDPDFAHQAMGKHRISTWRKHRQADYPDVLDSGAVAVCMEYGIPPADLHRRGKADRRSHARAAFAYRMHCEELLPLKVIADYLLVTIAAVQKLADRGRVLGAAVPKV